MNNLIYSATGLIFMSIGRKEDEDGPWTSVAPLAIRRGSFRQVKDFVRHIETFVAQYNPHARPFAWTATADSILAKLGRLCQHFAGTQY